jgi:hypothetical protein
VRKNSVFDTMSQTFNRHDYPLPISRKQLPE